MTDAVAQSAVAQIAASQWGLSPGDVRLAARRENAVYRVGDHALRLHRPGYRSDVELIAELQWMQALAAGGMQVPAPVASCAGRLVETVAGVQVSVITWLPGRMLGAQGALEGVADRVGLVRQLGALLAQMHDLSDAWTPPVEFTRPRWDADGLTGDAPLWGPFWDHPHLRPDQRALFLAARQAARAHLARLDAPDFGLIHADAITENLMLDGVRLSLIDFDDGGWGYRDFDLATFLFRQVAVPDYPALRAALLAGYAPRRKVDPAALDLFILLRALTYPGWIVPRLGEPGGAERSARAIAQAEPLARAYLAGLGAA